jgi:hypothetical protein
LVELYASRLRPPLTEGYPVCRRKMASEGFE